MLCGMRSMCEWGTDREVVIRRRVAVDACIAAEIEWMNDLGVHTTGCCCGHGKGDSWATIYPHSIQRARELGYTVTMREGFDPIVGLGVGPKRQDKSCPKCGVQVPDIPGYQQEHHRNCPSVQQAEQHTEGGGEREEATMKCHRCQRSANQIANEGRYLKRVNALGEVGVWECQPSCDTPSSGTAGDALLAALRAPAGEETP